VAQVMYDGEWKTRHAGISVLLQQFNRRTDIPVKFGHQELKLSDAKIFDAPILYITGHETFQLSDAEVQNLREYLNKGGFLMAEACCGRRAFNAAFMREMKKVFPDRSLNPLPAASPLFALPNQIKMVGVTPGLSSQLGGKTTIAPNLLGMEVSGIEFLALLTGTPVSRQGTSGDDVLQGFAGLDNMTGGEGNDSLKG